MTQQKRCDVCRLKATLDPKTVHDVLCYLSPPLALLEAIDRWIELQPDKIPQSVKDFRHRWRELMSDGPAPEVDAVIQAKLIEEKVKAKYG